MAVVDKIVDRLGGRASSRVIAILAAVLAFDSADKAAIGAMATQLESDFHITKTELGLLVTVSSLAGIIGLLPFGWLVDRTCRTRLLAIAVLAWGIFIVVCATATTYTYLLIIRLGLGVITAAATPAVASLIGDFFPASRRARIYSYILTGEALGTGFGFIISGELALVSWRLGLVALAVPTPLVAWLLYRLAEPVRGGGNWLQPDQEETEVPPHAAGTKVQTGIIGRLVRQTRVSPRENLVYDQNPADESLLWATRYVLQVPTNVVLIIASALGYYFIAGLRVFGVEYVHNWFNVPHTAAIGVVVTYGLCGLVGVLAGGRFADYLLGRGRLTARVTVAIGAYLAAVAFLLPVFLTRLLAVMVPTIMLAGFFSGAINPPLDAARLDIMHPNLWGRAESIRTTLRLIAEGLAPFVFGYMAEAVFGGGAEGVRLTFLTMLIPVAISGGIAFLAFRTYPRDVATAEAYTRRTQERPAVP